MIETEVKIKINEQKVKEIIKFLGNPEYFNQTNLIYQNCNGFLRLRKEKGNTIITSKGKRKDDKFGSREEIEFSIQGEKAFNILRQILKKIGLEETFYYDKKRACFEFGLCLICLDLVANGTYLEIEAKSNEDISRTIDFFDLDKKDIERRAYHKILQDDLHRKNL